MDAFPAFFPLTGARVVIAGSGEPAEAKARLFEGSPAEVVRIDGPQALLPSTYEGAKLAFVADADTAFAEAAAAAARAAHVPVNVTDRPLLCDFTTPAVIDRGEVVAAIGTAGASPMLATMLRHDIEQRIPEGAGRVAALFRRYQDEVRAALPQLHERRAFLRDALNGPAAEAAIAGQMDHAGELLLAALSDHGAVLGKVQVLAGDGPADLLTLRASRALAAADALAPDPGARKEILDLARRDAERVSGDVETLTDLVRQGRRVVRIVGADVALATTRTLERAGLTVELLPIGS